MPFVSQVENFFCMGSPLAVFLALRGIRPGTSCHQDHILPTSICGRLFNVFHPTDPVVSFPSLSQYGVFYFSLKTLVVGPVFKGLDVSKPAMYKSFSQICHWKLCSVHILRQMIYITYLLFSFQDSEPLNYYSSQCWPAGNAASVQAEF